MDLKSSPIKKYIKIIQKEYGENASDRLDSIQHKAAGEIAQQSSRLHQEYGYYLQEANREEIMRSDKYVNSYAANVTDDCRRILKLKAIDYLRYH